jgi:predicted metal-dependent hydrolase
MRRGALRPREQPSPTDDPSGPVCARWAEAGGGRASFRAEIYEWQVAALLATARVDDAAKERIVAALSDAPAPIDSRRVGRLEQELRSIALDNAFGRISDADYLRRKTDLTSEIEAARRPQRAAGAIDPAKAFSYLDDLRSLWENDLPEQPRHQHVRREYELGRAEATTAAFERLEALGPVIVEVKLTEDLLASRTLAMSLRPKRAELRGEQAAVMRQLLDGPKSRLVRADTPEARRKRRQRAQKVKVHWSGREA